MRMIPYALVGEQDEPGRDRQAGSMPAGRALSINISPGGMLLMMEQAPLRGQRLSITMPARAVRGVPPSKAEVCWTRPVPGASQVNVHFVGVKFLPPDA